MTATSAERPSSPPLCPEHPGRAASRTCSRCGKFVCRLCAGEWQVCTACCKQRVQALPPAAPRARWSIRFLAMCVACDVSFILVKLADLGTPHQGHEESPALDVRSLLVLASVVSLVGAAITFLNWLHLAVRHANAVGACMGTTPGWAVGCWFIPIVNLVKPYLIVRDVARGLGGGRTSAPIDLWWSLLIFGIVTSQAVPRFSRGPVTPPAGALDPSPWTMLAFSNDLSLLRDAFAYFFNLGAALVCIEVVRTIQRALDRHRVLGVDDASTHVPITPERLLAELEDAAARAERR